MEFLTQLEEQTEEEKTKQQILEKIQEIKEGKNEEYLDINEKDEGIFLGDE